MLLILLISVISFSTQAQIQVGNVSLDFGPKITAEKGEEIYIAGQKNNVMYTLVIQKKVYHVQLLKPEQTSLSEANKSSLKNQLVVRPSVTFQKGVGKYLIYASNKKDANLGTLTITE